jgi:hypothetical protein
MATLPASWKNLDLARRRPSSKGGLPLASRFLKDTYGNPAGFLEKPGLGASREMNAIAA